MKITAWTIGPPDFRSPIHVPYVGEDEGACWVQGESGYICTRLPGHTGRHTAATSDGMVCAVWGEQA